MTLPYHYHSSKLWFPIVCEQWETPTETETLRKQEGRSDIYSLDSSLQGHFRCCVFWLKITVFLKIISIWPTLCWLQELSLTTFICRSHNNSTDADPVSLQYFCLMCLNILSLSCPQWKVPLLNLCYSSWFKFLIGKPPLELYVSVSQFHLSLGCSWLHIHDAGGRAWPTALLVSEPIREN